MSYSVFVQKSLIVSLFELILPMFATRKPRRTSSPFKVILTEEKDIICFHRRKNKILAAKLQMFFDFAIDFRRFCSVKRENLSDKTPSRGFQSLFWRDAFAPSI